MSNHAVIVSDVRKSFILPQHKSRSLKQVFVNVFRRRKPVEQLALDGVSFTVEKGEFFGVIGRNGSGKSTLLKILAGVYTPTKGAVELHGGLTPFIELGVGFNPELSGRDNIYLNGALLGFSRKQMDEMYDDIVEFAELGKFMDQKLKNYSSGMQVRLAFSIAIKAKNDILIFDEVLAVGDENFQKKCIETFEELKRSGATIIFVSHAMGQVRQFCDRVAVISNGKVAFIGDTETAIDEYRKLNDDENIHKEEAKETTKTQARQRLGNGKVGIVTYALFDDTNKKSQTLKSGKPFAAQIELRAKEDVSECAVGIMFRKNPQENLYGINSWYMHESISLKAGETLRLVFRDTMPLNPGAYHVSFAVAGMQGVMYEDFDNLNNIQMVKVSGSTEYWGLVRPNAQLERSPLISEKGKK